MKLPRDVSGAELAQKLIRIGYRITRQTGSHIRLTIDKDGEHHITIPDHKSIKIGTLSSIMSDIASHFGKKKSDIIEKLFS